MVIYIFFIKYFKISINTTTNPENRKSNVKKAKLILDCPVFWNKFEVWRDFLFL